MGLACCTPLKPKQLSGGSQFDTPLRNTRCSQALNLQWENRGRVTGETDDSYHNIPLRPDRGYGEEIQFVLGSGRRNLSHGGSLLESFGTPISLRSPIHEEITRNEAPNISNTSTRSSYLAELQNLVNSPEIPESSSGPKILFSVNSSYSTPLDPSTPCPYPFPPNSTPSRRARRSPGRRLLRQISDSRILGLKSPNNHSLSEGRPSFVLSINSHDLAIDSSGSDGWSMQTFCELVASSQRGRWSFDGDHLDEKTSGSSSRFSCSPSLGPHVCSSCLKRLTDVQPCKSRVVAALDCGHTYHAECLEAATSEVDKFDPLCPACMSAGREKQPGKVAAKVRCKFAPIQKAKSHKISKNRIVDSHLGSDSDSLCGRESLSGATSSSKVSFLRRHFSFGSKWSKSVSQNDSGTKKGFWPRHQKG